MSYDWGKTMNENTDKPYAWQAVGGTIWTSEDNRPYTKPQWQGLTDDELIEILGYGKIERRRPTRDFDFVDVIDVKLTRSLINAIEAKLKAKNT